MINVLGLMVIYTHTFVIGLTAGIERKMYAETIYIETTHDSYSCFYFKTNVKHRRLLLETLYSYSSNSIHFQKVQRDAIISHFITLTFTNVY